MLQKNPTFFPQLNINSKTKIKQQAIQRAITKRFGWCQVFSESLTDPTPVLCAIISPSKANRFHGPSPKDAFKHSQGSFMKHVCPLLMLLHFPVV